MSLKVEDLLTLPSMRGAKLIAGTAAKGNIVNSISVLESTDPVLLTNTYFHHENFRTEEILITGFINTVQDIPSQCDCIRGLYEAGASGIIIFYVGVFLPRIDQSLIVLADELGFPIICMPENRVVLYGEVITDVLGAVFQEKKQKAYLVGEVLERVSKMSESQRTLDNLLRIISTQTHSSIALLDCKRELIHSSTWPVSNSPLFVNSSLLEEMQETGELSAQIFEMESGQQIHYSLFPIHFWNSSIRALAIISEYGAIEREQIAQVTEAIRLFVTLWGDPHEYQGTSELVNAILKDEPTKMRNLANIFKINISDLQTMWVFSFGENVDAEGISHYIPAIQTETEKYKLRCICGAFDKKVVVFIEKPTYTVDFPHIEECFIDELKGENKDFAFAVQRKLRDMSHAREMLQLSSRYIKYAKKIFPQKVLLTFEELLFAEKCLKIIEQGESEIQQRLAPLLSLYPEDAQWQQELINTLCVFLLDAQSSILQTSEIIHLHKSTIKYRIKSINDVFGYSVQKMPESYSLYLAAAIKRLLD